MRPTLVASKRGQTPKDQVSASRRAKCYRRQKNKVQATEGKKRKGDDVTAEEAPAVRQKQLRDVMRNFQAQRANMKEIRALPRYTVQFSYLL
jgi:hypothetical protein